MQLRPLLAVIAMAFSGIFIANAQEAPAADSPAAGIEAIDARLEAKIKAGLEAPADFAEEAAMYDELLAKYAGDKSDAVAMVAYEQAYFTFQFLEDEDTAGKQAAAISENFPGTETVAKAEKLLSLITRVQEGRIKQAALIGKEAPELHFIWSTKEGLKTLSELRGQVVVLDFWATWCGPCIRSFPDVREHVAHFANSPVTFLGVTSLQGRVSNLEAKPIDTKDDPEKEMGLTPAFIAKHNMTWNVAFSEEKVYNPDYAITGIPYVAIIAPDGTVRHTGLHPANKAADIAGKITAILKEFGLPTPE